MLPWLSGLVSTVTGGLLDKVFGNDTQTATQAPSFVPVSVPVPAPSPPPPAPAAPAIPTWVYIAGGAAVLVLLGVMVWRR